MMQIRKVVLFKGIIDSLDAFAEELAGGFKRLGLDVLLVNVNDLRYYQDDLFAKINSYIYDKDAIVIFMNNIGMLMEDLSGGNYWNQSGVRCFDILADPPYFYDEAIRSDIDNVTFVCVDESHARYINRYYGKDSRYFNTTGRTRKAVFMPLAGMQWHANRHAVRQNNRHANRQKDWHADWQNDRNDGYPLDICFKNNKPYDKRKYDVVFTGNYSDYNDIDTETSGMDECLLNLWDVVLSNILKDSTLTIEDALFKCMKDFNLQLNDDAVLRIMVLFKRMDSVVRAKYRADVIRSIADSGINIHVFGRGWELLELNSPNNLIIHEQVSYRESVKIMQDTKIALNVMPWFKKGFHDRIATAALNGCVCLTDTAEYTEKIYVDGCDIIYYDLKDLQELPDKINDILNNPGRAKEIAYNGFKKAAATDTWYNRAEWFKTL